MNAPFSAARIRDEFPVFRHHPDLVYLDNAATTHKPATVLDAERTFYETANANVHRAAHRLGSAATDAFEGARTRIAAHLNAAHADEIVFTRGTTEAINLAAYSWGRANLRPGDVVLLSTLEHHANIVPWQLVAQQTGAVVRPVPLGADGQLDPDAYQALLARGVKLVGLTQCSNATGVQPPLAAMIAAAKAAGATVLVDGAQGIAHDGVDVQALGADFYAFSGHKAYGPTGIGALWARRELLAQMPPWQGGGEMIERVSFDGTTFAEPPFRFEAGTPPIAQAVGLAAALGWLANLDRDALLAHELALRDRFEAGLAGLDDVRILGAGAPRGAISALTFDGIHPYDVAQFLDGYGVAARVGQHCAGPLHQALGIAGSLRFSFAAYNTDADVDTALAALASTLELLR
ncbi:aminotransferase class V-fold PLP-dependent enzyme [Jeongeupia sp. USM3]|uniref:aminotransferase class V-fold PLP-dependent enzyme n=1 Tax=Jeongeupia sp. USM3 TaxID=1906741 RepID=UPI00089DFFDF|nr:SufS family cysteine desulfurase [Jeongeupia sp. USM3]AOX99247.1 cysteine desulfurase [Jeongeupia sp. USM3]